MAPKRWVGLATLLATCVVGGPAVAAQEPLPTVRIDSTESPQVFTNACVEPFEVEIFPGSVVLSRTGDADASLSVTYEITGPVAPTSGVAVFDAGQATATIELVPEESAGPRETIEVALAGGDDYQLGDPSSASIEVAFATTTCVVTTITTVTTVVTTTVAPPPQVGSTGTAPATSVLARTGPPGTNGRATSGALGVGIALLIGGSAFLGAAQRLRHR